MSETGTYRLLLFLDGVPVKAVLVELDEGLLPLDAWTRMEGGVNNTRVEIEFRRVR